MTLYTESRLRKKQLTGIPNPFIVHEGDKITPAALDYLRDHKINIIYEKQQKHQRTKRNDKKMKIPVGVSNRHVHLSEEHVEQLFGKGYELQKFRDLTQPGQYAAIETVTILGPKGFINNVRVLGPIREETQVEISKTDGFTLGVHPPVRLSGSIDNTPGLTLIGPEGYVVIDKGTIVAKNHVHMSPDEAKQFSVDDHDTLMLKTLTDRPMILPEVIVRVNDQFKLDCHLDLDEGNAANVRTGDELAVVGKNGMLFA